jgi:hypothetical protein
VDIARRVEIAGLAELFRVSRIVTEFGIVEAEFHVAREGNGPALADFLFDLFDEADSQSLPAAVGAVLRGADEHFDEVVVQRVVELALEAPFELRVVEVAGMKVEIIRVHRDRSVLELDDDFHAFAFGARGKVQQGMLVKAELGEDAVEARGGGFGRLCAQPMD